jgi:hypothetical protein
MVGLPYKLVKGETSFAEVRDKVAERRKASCDSLNPLEVLN